MIQSQLLPLSQQEAKIPLGYDLAKALATLEDLSSYYSQLPFLRRSAVFFGQPAFDDDQEGMLRNLTQFVKDRVTYVNDPMGFELVTAPDILLIQILEQGQAQGDCDDHVLLLNTMCLAVGIPAKVAAVKLYSNDLYDHVISMIQMRGQWIEIDPCAKHVSQRSYPDKYMV